MNKKGFMRVAASTADDLTKRILKDDNDPLSKIMFTTLLIDYANALANAMHLEESEHDKL